MDSEGGSRVSSPYPPENDLSDHRQFFLKVIKGIIWQPKKGNLRNTSSLKYFLTFNHALSKTTNQIHSANAAAKTRLSQTNEVKQGTFNKVQLVLVFTKQSSYFIILYS